MSEAPSDLSATTRHDMRRLRETYANGTMRDIDLKACVWRGGDAEESMRRYSANTNIFPMPLERKPPYLGVWAEGLQTKTILDDKRARRT